MTPFENCLKNGRLVAAILDEDQIRKEFATAAAEMGRGRACYTEGRYEECVVQGYFAMYRALRVLLRKAGYRDTNLYSLGIGIEQLYVQEGKLEAHLLEILRLAKDQKDLVHEGARCSKKETKLILDGAEEAMRATRELLELADLPEIKPSGPPKERPAD